MLKNKTIPEGSLKRRNVRNYSVFLIWLMHISAIIGIALGHESWFIEKTPLNLLVSAALLIINFPVKNSAAILAFTLFFFAGFIAEWIGVNTGILFGDYAYGPNLGVKIGGVPLLIGVNWAVLVFITAVLSDRLSDSVPVKVMIGSTLMVLLDLLMEKSAPPFGFWAFRDGIVPVWNYVCWFLLAALLHLRYNRLGLKGDRVFSLHLLAANFIFFLWFYVR